MRSEIMNDPAGVLIGELKNLQDIADCIKPSRADLPVLDGIDFYGETLSLNEAGGGDHLIYVDFQKRHDLQARMERADAQGRDAIVGNLKRCRRMAGMLRSDVSGHHGTDTARAAMLHEG